MKPSPEATEDLRNRFNYHAPHNESVKKAHEMVRAQMFGAASTVVDCCPEGREQALALTKLEEAMFWANAAIARNQTAFL